MMSDTGVIWRQGSVLNTHPSEFLTIVITLLSSRGNVGCLADSLKTVLCTNLSNFTTLKGLGLTTFLSNMVKQAFIG